MLTEGQLAGPRKSMAGRSSTSHSLTIRSTLPPQPTVGTYLDLPRASTRFGDQFDTGKLISVNYRDNRAREGRPISNLSFSPTRSRGIIPPNTLDSIRPNIFPGWNQQTCPEHQHHTRLPQCAPQFHPRVQQRQANRSPPRRLLRPSLRPLLSMCSPTSTSCSSAY